MENMGKVFRQIAWVMIYVFRNLAIIGVFLFVLFVLLDNRNCLARHFGISLVNIDQFMSLLWVMPLGFLLLFLVEPLSKRFPIFKSALLSKFIYVLIIIVIVFGKMGYEQIHRYLSYQNEHIDTALCEKVVAVKEGIMEGNKMEDLSLEEYKIVRGYYTGLPEISERAEDISFIYLSEDFMGDMSLNITYFVPLSETVDTIHSDKNNFSYRENQRVYDDGDRKRVEYSYVIL